MSRPDRIAYALAASVIAWTALCFTVKSLCG